MPDGRDFVPTFLGATWAGIIPVPLPPPLSLGKLDSYLGSLAAVMNKAEPAYLATTAKIEDVLGSAASRVPSLHGVVTAEDLRPKLLLEPRASPSSRARTTSRSCSSPPAAPRRRGGSR
jgi:acyl-CoA synthetase (AMP-forming)/AMP-acid ligase II